MDERSWCPSQTTWVWIPRSSAKPDLAGQASVRLVQMPIQYYPVLSTGDGGGPETRKIDPKFMLAWSAWWRRELSSSKATWGCPLTATDVPWHTHSHIRTCTYTYRSHTHTHTHTLTYNTHVTLTYHTHVYLHVTCMITYTHMHTYMPHVYTYTHACTLTYQTHSISCTDEGLSS